MKDRAPILSFEGIDGSGKSTQLRRVSEALDRKGIDNKRFREPGTADVSEQIRSILLDDNNPSDISELLLFQAARAEMFEKKVKPAVYDGTIALLDRAGDSTIAYQGFGLYEGNPDMLELISQNNELAYAGLPPDRTYWIDISAEESIRRLPGDEKDRIESKNMSFKKRVNEGYRHVHRQYHERVIQIDGERPKDEITSEVQDDVMDYLSSSGYA